MKRILMITGTILVVLSGVVYAMQRDNPAPYSAEEYIQFLTIEELYAGRGNVGETTGMPIVWFKVRNNGVSTIEHIQVTVEFLNDENQVVFEKKLHPVHQGRESGEPVQPLGPNEVWQMSAIRYYIVRQVPHTWQLGNVRAKITEIEFKT
ncbi:hypothetical protein [Kordiimonas laminariae]|uniref:hypothetical protein n=1 Tax=Kordiimonas laminariae TaxID=2917717 RepID=UPI001FF2F4C6|nr:hypothetical protein [Kordiimonas laminariae]MCK0070667.1 hypothetical protein [Kordiimonas laminariae]